MSAALLEFPPQPVTPVAQVLRDRAEEPALPPPATAGDDDPSSICAAVWAY